MLATCSAAFAAPAAWSATPGAVAGLVRAAATEAPIAGIEVCARGLAEPLGPATCATSGATGEYEIAGLAEGHYNVSFSPAKSGLNYVTQYFEGRATEALADPVSVLEATTTQKVNASMQSGGEIKGGVTEAEGKPLVGIEVCALEKGLESPVRCVLSKGSGNYAIAGLASGEYEVEFSAPAGYEPSYARQFYNGASSRSAATVLAVTAGGAAVKGVNAVLASPSPGGSIAGAVSSAATGAPLPGAHVCALSTASSLESCTVTEATGAYTLAALAPGDYHVQFVSPDAGEAYEPQWYNEKAGAAEAEVVTVTGGATTGSIDARLQPLTPPAGAIAGTVTSAATKAPLAGVEVCARNAASEVERCVATEASGAYALAALPTGPYVVHFVPAAAGSSYAPQFYNSKANEAEAESVTVTADATVTGIDAVLQGIPVAVLRPAIAGRAAEGQILSLLTGTWTNAPTLTDEWGQCDATGAIETCHTIATTPTYTATAQDVGCTIRIREQASNEFGVGTPVNLFSPPTAPVTTASGGAGTCRPAPSAAPAWSPPATSGVSSKAARAASNSQLKALLTKLLVPSGRGARIAALRGRGRYVFTFSSLAAGRLTISWYLKRKGAHAASAKKPVLVARGRLTTKAGGTARLTIRPTTAGRALLAKGKPLTLTARGTFAPSGRRSLSATRSFKLKP